MLPSWISSPGGARARSARRRGRSVGKRSGRHSLPQAEITRLLIEAARDGRVVARLKGGDPFVFGRGGEEAEALVARHRWEVVPGISAVSQRRLAGIPFYIASGPRGGIVSGHPGCDPGRSPSSGPRSSCSCAVVPSRASPGRCSRAAVHGRRRRPDLPPGRRAPGGLQGRLGELARLIHLTSRRR